MDSDEINKINVLIGSAKSILDDLEHRKKQMIAKQKKKEERQIKIASNKIISFVKVHGSGRPKKIFSDKEISLVKSVYYKNEKRYQDTQADLTVNHNIKLSRYMLIRVLSS